MSRLVALAVGMAVWSAGATVATVATVAAVAAAPAVAPTRPLSIAIVAGSNRSPSGTLDALRFADDDAIQNARLFTLFGADTTLLVTPDVETRDLFPGVRPQGAVTGAALRAAFARAATQVAAARGAGRSTRLYFAFAGHGDTTTDGRPFLQLEDGRLWPEDLADLLRAAGAGENHVIVDACYAAQFVGGRGPGGQRARLPPGFSRGQRTPWPPHTGFLTARSSGGQTHEWAEFQAGIFSHEVRSGLLGAADANLDGRVTYREIAAFVQRANGAIPNRRYRPEVSAAPPGGDLDTVLAALPAGPILLQLDGAQAGRMFVESESGIRLADLNAAPGVPVHLRLPVDLGELFVEQPAAHREIRVEPRAGVVRLAELTSEIPRVRARGAAHEAFLLLFAQPFDQAAVATFQIEAPGDEHPWDPPAPARRRWVGGGLMAAGGLGLVAALAFGLSAHGLAHDAAMADGMRRAVLDQDIQSRNHVAWVAGGAGVTLIATGITWLLWRREAHEEGER